MVEHCFTTRLGGLSEGMFESLNLSFTRGDDEEKVLENYKKSGGGNRSRGTDRLLRQTRHILPMF